MRVVVVASADLDATDAQHLDAADLLIAADGGAASLDRIGRRPDVLVGDLDSADDALVARLSEAGTRVERHPAAKDASDSELAMRVAVDSGATDVVLAGAIGGARLDHALANVLLLTSGWLAGRDARLASGGTTVRIARAAHRVELDADIGDLVTLLPLGGDARGVTTSGLRWALDRAALTMGTTLGLSNEVVARPASVAVEHGMVLVVETAASAATGVVAS